MTHKAPRSPRETIEMFARYEPAAGADAGQALASLLDALDWTGVSPRQIYWAMLGRLPESPGVSVRGPGYAPARHAAAALRSPEFRRRVLNFVLGAYPEKRRLLFVHVPKCAGTDLRARLVARHPTLFDKLREPEWFDDAEMFDTFRRLALALREAEAIFVTGHVPLSWHLTNTYRFSDALFTVVRDPVELVISQANFLAGRLRADPEARQPDTRHWLGLLGAAPGSLDLSEEGAASLAERVLHEPRLVSGTTLCTFLGRGDAESALALLPLADIEITDTRRYGAWLRARWGIVSDRRENASHPFLARERLEPAQLRHILALTEQDRRLHDRIAERLDRSGGLAITGPELV